MTMVTQIIILSNLRINSIKDQKLDVISKESNYKLGFRETKQGNSKARNNNSLSTKNCFLKTKIIRL